MKHIISVLLENEAGALSRVVGLFSQRGFNIESLTVAPTEDDTLSRMTIVTYCDDDEVEHRKHDDIHHGGHLRHTGYLCPQREGTGDN